MDLVLTCEGGEVRSINMARQNKRRTCSSNTLFDSVPSFLLVLFSE